MNAFHQRFYDNLSRLLTANYDGGAVEYSYGYDLSGNLVNNNGTTRTFNAANQMTNDGTNTLTYDNNGNLTSDGSNSYTWDRANRLLIVGNHSYAYDGNGARIQKTVSSVVTDYLLDVQPGLTQVLRESDGTNTNHYIHSPRGIHAMSDGSNWSYMLQDGLGSVRAEIAQNVAVNGSQSYAPYGEVFGASGSMSSPYGFTGEQTDGNGQVYLRARYYNPSIGVFNALDPFEGTMQRPMSLNGYSWVEGNPVMWTDPSGMETEFCIISSFDAAYPNNIFSDDLKLRLWITYPEVRRRVDLCERNLAPNTPIPVSTPTLEICPTPPPPTLTSTPPATSTPLPPATSTPIGAIANIKDWEIKLLAYAMVRESIVSEQWIPQAYVFLNRLIDDGYHWQCGAVGNRSLQCVLQGSNNLAVAVSAFYGADNVSFDLLTLNADQMESFWNTCLRGQCGEVTPQLLQQALPILTNAVSDYATGSNPYAGLVYFAHSPTVEEANNERRKAQCLGDKLATNVGTLFMSSEFSPPIDYDGDVSTCSTP